MITTDTITKGTHDELIEHFAKLIETDERTPYDLLNLNSIGEQITKLEKKGLITGEIFWAFQTTDPSGSKTLEIERAYICIA